MRLLKNMALVTGALLAAGAGCDGTQDTASQNLGRLGASLRLADVTHDVTRMHYKVVRQGDGCEGAAVAERTANPENRPLPGSVQPSGGGPLHAFFDAFFTLDPGDYRVCATPMAGQEPSRVCARAEGNARVNAQQTTEILLISQCQGRPRGGLDVITALNDPPIIETLDIQPGKFISTCDRATITATASDPNGDALSYAWTILAGPPGAMISASGNPATFSTGTPGDYTVKLTVTDVHGGATSLTFPMHVVAGDCAPAVGTTGTTGVISGAPWIVCRADSQTAWVAANNAGEYDGVAACQSLGYSGVNAWGGTCGTVCGYCGQLGNEHYDGAGASSPTYIRFTVHWRCVK